MSCLGWVQGTGERLHLQSTSASLFLAVGTSSLKVTLNQQFAGIDQLDDVDDLLEQHDWGRDRSNDPRKGAIDLVGAGHLESTRAPGAGEKIGRLRVSRVSGLDGGGLGIGDGLQERGRQHRRRERKKVEADEEDLVEGTTDE